MIRRFAAFTLVPVLAFLLVSGALAGFVGIDAIEKPSGTGISPYNQATSGVWKTWPATNTAADTTATYSIFCRDARRVLWWVRGTGTATAPCSLLTAYVSNNDSSWTDASALGMTVNDDVTGQRLDCASANGCGRFVEVTIGGVARIKYDRMLLVLTRKRGLAGAADSLRVSSRLQWD